MPLMPGRAAFSSTNWRDVGSSIVTTLLAQEIRPPKGEEPITSILPANLEVISLEQAVEKIQWYLYHWQIELYFRILKNGCKIEKLQQERSISIHCVLRWNFT